MKYSNTTGAVRWSGGLTVLKDGDSIDDDHPLLEERPDLFTDDPPGADIKMPATSSRGEPAPKVERATREPGEVRAPAAPTAAAVTPPRRRGRSGKKGPAGA